MTIKNFYPKFPFIRSSKLDPYYGKNFNDVIVSKKEFASEKLPKNEPLPDKPGDLLRHQKYIATFIGSDTGYDELLLFHEPGTGKTCTAVAVAEELLKKERWIKGVIVCSKGDKLNRNFLQELAFTCTANEKYLPEGYRDMTDSLRAYRIKRLVEKYYIFKTFETFAKELESLSDERIINKYDKYLFIVDEVHNLREHTETATAAEDDYEEELKKMTGNKRTVNIYSQFFRLFHTVPRRKILLLSGTPIKDTPEEFASVMNLILPLDLQFVSDAKLFVRRYFDSDGKIRSESKFDMIEKIKGRISYLISPTSETKKQFIGTKFGNLRHFIVSIDTMSDFQTKAYERSYAEDSKTKSIYNFSRQASLFVFPDGSVGSKGYEKYIVERPHQYIGATLEFYSEIDTLDKLKRLSGKYAFVLEKILSEKRSKHFIYCQYVKGSGSIILAKILEKYGYSKATGNERNKNLRYALCTNQTASNATIQQIINRFNDDDNVDGEYISVIIGSKVLNEGFTLKTVRSEFILTPHWNYAETAQAIARGWRLGSHKTLLDRGDISPTVKIYQCVSIPNSNVPSIDLEMYETSEKKDIINRRIERLVKESAFDCPLTIDRNKVQGYDGQRECDYDVCDYDCDGKIEYPLDSSTYDLNKSYVNELKNLIIAKLKLEFKKSKEYSFSKLKKKYFSSYDNFILNLAIEELIDSNEIFLDKFGFVNFLRLTDDTLFLSCNISGCEIFNLFYSQNLILETKKSFSSILNELYESNLPIQIERIFTSNDALKILVKLPKLVQRIVLYGCILAKDANKTKNAITRNDILNFYSGLYSLEYIEGIGNTWVISLYSDTLGRTYYDKSVKDFVEYTIDKEAEKVVGIKYSPVGWLGLYNPTLNDFCIRKISDDTNKTEDLRKLNVGKRCVNFDHSLLVNLAVDKMLIPYPDDYLENVSSFDEIAEKLKSIKFTVPYEEKNNINYAKRLLYWSSQRKIELCEAIKNWFSERNLLETNFDCGTQKKSRAKFL